MTVSYNRILRVVQTVVKYDTKQFQLNWQGLYRNHPWKKSYSWYNYIWIEICFWNQWKIGQGLNVIYNHNLYHIKKHGINLKISKDTINTPFYCMTQKTSGEVRFTSGRIKVFWLIKIRLFEAIFFTKKINYLTAAAPSVTAKKVDFVSPAFFWLTFIK